MECPARRRLTVASSLGLVLFLLLVTTPARATRAVSFNVSTNRTFSPDEKPTIHLYARDVDELEFRVYRVNDPEKFLTNIPDLHSFGNTYPNGPKEQIDERTWLERFHDWKHHIWFLIRQFFRRQFSTESRDYFRAKQASLAKRSRIVGVAQFAQIPLLNDRQLVARWRQEMPPTYISDSQDLPVDKLPAGLYLVEATDGHYKAYTLLMVSRIVLITRTSTGSILAFVVDRQSGTPIPNALVAFGVGRNEQGRARTDADGVAELHGAANVQNQEDSLWVVATANDEFAAVTPMAWSLNNSDSGKWASYVYTDRPVYRPGHTVHWKALLRARVANHLELPKIASILVRISDEQDHPLFDQQLPVTSEGAVSGDIVIPANASLGYYNIRLGSDAEVSGSFHVEEYRKPEYQVRVTAQTQRVLQGQTNQVVIDSRYFFGEPVAFGKVKYRIYHSPHYWWDEDEDQSGDTSSGDEDQSSDTDMYGADQQSEQTAKLDANGKLTIGVPTKVDSSDRHTDQDYIIEAGVTDEANREITGRGHFLATYGSYRIHIEPDSYAVRFGDNAHLTLTAVDYDNKPVQTHVHLALTWRRYSDGKTVTTDGGSTDVTTDARGTAHAAIPVSQSGSAEVLASSNTPEGRTVVDESYLWVFGGNEADWFSGGSQSVQIVADKKTYAPGDTAHLSLISQVDHFHALVVATGYSVEFRKVISSDGMTVNFDMPITTDSQPNLDVSVYFLNDGQLYQASQQIKVPPVEEQLQVEIERSKDVFQPEQPAEYDVYTRDFRGKPVSADLSFGVVDEAIYSIYPDTSGDMVRTLYPSRFSYAAVDTSLQYYFSGTAGDKSPELAQRASRYRPRLAQVKPGNDMVQPKVRKAFPDTAYWAPTLHTDAQGHVHVKFTFPDSLTTWRATVRAITADSRAGSAIDRVIVRKNVIVRMGTPRFLRKGDEITIPVIAHNYLDQAKQVQISLDIHGLDLVVGATKQINVASKSDGTVLWRVKASAIGTADLLAKALTNEESDALELTFPVEPSGVRQTISHSGVVTGPTASSVIDFPANTDPAAQELHIEVSPSITGSLFSALDYLTSYPWGCTEQTMSSFLPNVIVAETLKKLNLTGHIDPTDLQAKVDAGFDRLADYQHDDGGWGWWKEDSSRVLMTAYVVSGLGEAANYFPLTPQRQQMLQNGRSYLEKQLAQHPHMIPDLRAYV
ncbi:MAG: alpha-2-macroglobulin family protein, partial [Acidobacteriaceae bacterium]